MLSESQAREIVKDSIRKISGTEQAFKPDKTLEDAGFVDKKLNDLVITIAADSEVGVPRFQHDLNINNFIDELKPATTIEVLADKVLKLSAGKVCSNPHNPHDQKCCPYPVKCPQCGYPVL